MIRIIAPEVTEITEITERPRGSSELGRAGSAEVRPSGERFVPQPDSQPATSQLAFLPPPLSLLADNAISYKPICQTIHQWQLEFYHITFQPRKTTTTSTCYKPPSTFYNVYVSRHLILDFPYHKINAHVLSHTAQLSSRQPRNSPPAVLAIPSALLVEAATANAPLASVKHAPSRHSLRDASKST